MLTCSHCLPCALTQFQVPAVYQNSWQTRAPLRKEWGKKPSLSWWGFPETLSVSDPALPYTRVLCCNSLHPTFKPGKRIPNGELEVHLHTQHCNLMLSIQGWSHSYNTLRSINSYHYEWAYKPPPPPQATFHFSSMISCPLTIFATRGS